jgi:hypothetical protein
MEKKLDANDLIYYLVTLVTLAVLRENMSGHSFLERSVLVWLGVKTHIQKIKIT